MIHPYKVSRNKAVLLTEGKVSDSLVLAHRQRGKSEQKLHRAYSVTKLGLCESRELSPTAASNANGESLASYWKWRRHAKKGLSSLTCQAAEPQMHRAAMSRHNSWHWGGIVEP